MDCSPLGCSVHGDSPRKNTGVGCPALLQGIFLTQGSDPGIEPRSPAMQVDSLPTKPPRKPKGHLLNGKGYMQTIYLVRVKIQLYKECVQFNIKQTNGLKNG